MTRLAQRVMHCPCGDSKVLSLGLCATCYTLKRQDEEYFGGLRERFWSVMDTVAVSVTPPVATNAPSSFTTAYPASRSEPDAFALSCLSCQSPPHQSGALNDAATALGAMA